MGEGREDEIERASGEKNEIERALRRKRLQKHTHTKGTEKCNFKMHTTVHNSCLEQFIKLPRQWQERNGQ